MISPVPVRLCCGHRHSGVICPDGLVMCCLCFHRVMQDDLNRTEDGKLEDVCRWCAEDERACQERHALEAREAGTVNP